MLRPLVQPKLNPTYALAQRVSGSTHLLTTGGRVQNIWPGNISANIGATIDDAGVTIDVATPSQVYFGWNGASAAGHRHRFSFVTADVTGSFTIVGRVNTGNVLVPETTIAPSTVVVIDIPTAGGETGWSFRSVTITTGRLDCLLQRVG